MNQAKRAALVGLILLAFERPTYGYLDPGSGSMLLQVMLGGFAALGVVGKLYWHRLLELLGKRPRDEHDAR